MLTAPDQGTLRRHPWPTLALLLAGVVHTIVLVSLPVFVGGITKTFGWGDREVGWLASADMAGSAIMSLCIILFIGRLPWRPTACAAIAIIVLGNLLSVAADSFTGLLATRFLCGLGGGVLLSVCYVGLCRSSNPDRYFGIYVFVQLSLQILTLASFPSLIEASGIDGIFLLLAAVAVACLPLVLLFPPHLPQASTDAIAPARAPIAAGATVGLLAQVIYFLAPAAVWGYFERIGQGFSLSLEHVGRALGLSSFAGLAGALLVVLLGLRVARRPSMAAGTALSIIAMIVLMDGSGYTRYLVAAALFNFAWNFTFPYQMGVLAALDRTGAVAILSLMAQLGGLALGPLLASTLNPEGGYGTILFACMGCYVLSLALFFASERIGRGNG